MTADKITELLDAVRAETRYPLSGYREYRAITDAELVAFARHVRRETLAECEKTAASVAFGNDEGLRGPVADFGAREVHLRIERMLFCLLKERSV